ncbi:MAG: Borrelia P83 multi-domain protein [Candidatus Nomurabacteria bacterium GW2011_GWE1_32_28]|uniref:Borrelia P83 multi-domain protein n=1 Tax=Candidatus Nomurabacteria bacterium GW2011_GWF1_31_48 TaxID=1618767 RepID=A0A0F9YVA9_9BACT|nr:MAG: Borrelia P83 multi-domain protein [Candidatus Nomurabacteria bacterium GW2011_GWF2_30_133]KKP28833.1 MAG: Borrelia P83 multi-domain protein [Candidatus Nomurabacteria bacterium GW2011_GWE2_31_40]KKP30411.1 MAG: Borrelia P83 multi-domain protein [Candidatus Nomurabacteria bacterium GW2011_GWF1_31_48]KKP34938.1 MAG: Borrelia P83 multi-domain protein [Candidatus Nomurabacteria bacterium GW2011_GWE1_32_28]HAS81028.1 hypothetical protein [Candidatus Nomurabacteria bacterium]
MKKYLSLFLVLVMAFTMSVKTIKAEEENEDVAVPTLYSQNMLREKSPDPKRNPSLLIKEQKMEELRKEKETVGIEMREKREEAVKSMQEAKDEFKLKMEQEKGNMTEEVRAQIEAKKEEAKQIMEQAREKMKEAGEKIREEIQTRREEAKTKMEELRTQIGEIKDAAKAKIAEERIVGREKALERFDKVVENINELKNKVNDQITKLEIKGVDITTAENFVLTSETKLNDAKIKITEINTLLAISVDQLSDTDKTTLKEQIQNIQTLVKEAHQALNDAIKSLRENVQAQQESTATNITDMNTTDSEEAETETEN